MSLISKPSDLTFFYPDKGMTFPLDFDFIDINRLSDDAAIPGRHKRVLLLETLYLKTAVESKEPQGQSWYSKKDSGKVNYERIIYARDMMAVEGKNIVAIIIGKKTNVNFFRDVLSIRDGPHLGPGGVFAIEAPSNIEQWMSGSQVPLFFTPDSIIAIDMAGMCKPDRHIVVAGNSQHAFCYSNVQVTLCGLTMQEINCCGDLCDAYGMYENSEFASSCGCIMLNKYDAHVSGIFELVFKKEVDNIDILSEFSHVKNYTSKKFTRMFFRGGKMPVGLTARSFSSERRVRTELVQKVESAIGFVNAGGVSKAEENRGFTIEGWVRRGKIADRGVELPPVAGQNQKKLQDASSLVMHITSITPTCKKVAEELAGDPSKLFDAAGVLMAANAVPPAVGGAAGGTE